MYFSTIPSTSFCFCFMMSAPMFMAMLVTMGSRGSCDPMLSYNKTHITHDHEVTSY